MNYKKADIPFSIWIRRRDADEYGIVDCPLCEHQYHWKHMVNAHFIRRAILVTRWNLDNCHATCSTCNTLMESDPDLAARYGLWVIEKIGADRYTELMILRQTQPKFTQSDIDEIADKYRKLNK